MASYSVVINASTSDLLHQVIGLGTEVNDLASYTVIAQNLGNDAATITDPAHAPIAWPPAAPPFNAVPGVNLGYLLKPGKDSPVLRFGQTAVSIEFAGVGSTPLIALFVTFG